MSWFSPDYLKGSKVNTHDEEVNAMAALNGLFPTIDKASIRVMTRSKTRAFVDRYLDTDRIVYRAPFPVCHTFAFIAYAQFLLGALREGFTEDPACYVTALTLQSARHRLIAWHVIDDETGKDAVDYLQAEGGDWVTLPDIKEVSIDSEEA